jgi:hypothetical protein
MMLKLVKPILSKISQVKLLPVPAPSVEVTAEAQARYNADVRKEMKNKVWEKDGGVSWYVDQETGLCTVSSERSPVPLALLLERGGLNDADSLALGRVSFCTDSVPLVAGALLVEGELAKGVGLQAPRHVDSFSPLYLHL